MSNRNVAEPSPQNSLPLSLGLSLALCCAVGVATAHAQAPRSQETLAPAATDAIRIRRDEPRDRTWVLRADGLHLYEQRGIEPARRFALPGWVYVTPRHACEPDVLIEAGGSVLVSSNIVPGLWRIDPSTSTASTIELEIVPATSRDFGFTSLRLADNGVLEAHDSIDGSRWRIDLAKRRAVQVSEGVIRGALDGCE